MWVRLNDDVRLKVKQEIVDKNPFSIYQGRNIHERKKGKLNILPSFFNIVINRSIKMLRLDGKSEMVMRHE